MRQSWFVLMTILGAGFISLALQGNYDFFPIYVRNPVHPELLAWMGVSVVCGLMAGLMSWLLVTAGPRLVPTSTTARHAALVAGLVGLMVACIALLTEGETIGTGYHAASDLLNTPLGLSHELGFSLLKLLATVLSYLSGIPGGIFTPSLSIGAGLGYDFALLFDLVEGRQMLVLIGMTAFLAGVVQAPVTATVIVMEMTSSQDQFMSLMLSSVIATLVAKSIARVSLYEVLARRLLEGLQDNTKKLSET
jgi:H+/Cl- antiporter ClcA